MNPVAIGNSQRKQQLRLNWPDGREQLLDHAELRRQCPCSQCRAFRLQGLTPRVDARVRIIELNAQGYGLQLVFSDGHERGIYPWALPGTTRPRNHLKSPVGASLLAMAS